MLKVDGNHDCVFFVIIYKDKKIERDSICDKKETFDMVIDVIWNLKILLILKNNGFLEEIK